MRMGGIIVPEFIIAPDQGTIFQPERPGEIQRTVFQRGIVQHGIGYADLQAFKRTVFHIFTFQCDGVVDFATGGFRKFTGVDLPNILQLDRIGKGRIHIHNESIVFEFTNHTGSAEFSGKSVVAEAGDRSIAGETHIPVDGIVFDIPVAGVPAVGIVGVGVDPAVLKTVVAADQMGKTIVEILNKVLTFYGKSLHSQSTTVEILNKVLTCSGSFWHYYLQQ